MGIYGIKTFIYLLCTPVRVCEILLTPYFISVLQWARDMTRGCNVPYMVGTLGNEVMDNPSDTLVLGFEWKGCVYQMSTWLGLLSGSKSDNMTDEFWLHFYRSERHGAFLSMFLQSLIKAKYMRTLVRCLIYLIVDFVLMAAFTLCLNWFRKQVGLNIWSSCTPFLPRQFEGQFRAGSKSQTSSLHFDSQRNSSWPGKLVQQQHQHFACLKSRAAFLRQRLGARLSWPTRPT